MKRVWQSIAALLLAGVAAQAGNAVCTVSTSGVAFGAYNPLPGASADTNGTIAVTCSGTAGDTAAYTITITAGLGSFSARKMLAGTDALTYNMYKDSACTQVWGDGSGGTSITSDSVTLTSSSLTSNYVVYSRIAGGQRTAKANVYSDSLLVTVTY
jgi:spore coat protein U domain-containing protein, fimbrial subunit CupE1/2/3/6